MTDEHDDDDDECLIRNAAKCLRCGDVIESKHVHDFVSCRCGNISVDGGLEYARRAFKTKEWEDLSELAPK